MIDTSVCFVPGCLRPVSASRIGLSTLSCRYHIQFKSRHGSHWHATYPADELRPYNAATSIWLKANHAQPEVTSALRELDYKLAFAGRIDPAMNLRGQSAAVRANIAFARLREAGVTSQRLAAIYLGVSALIEDDWGSHRVREFRIVQAAKAAHRLASGTHRRWEIWNPVGPPVRTELHVYPRSSGLVLRKIGTSLEKACGALASWAVPEIIALKAERHGEHASHLHPMASQRALLGFSSVSAEGSS